MTFANIENWPELEHPVLVVGLDGWIDAGFVGQLAVNNLTEVPHDLVATFNMDTLIDNRSRRPVLRLVNGVMERLVWPDLRLLLSRPPQAERSVLVLAGPEPDYHWRAWTEEVVGLGQRMGVEMVVGLGAFPAPVPHTRPIRVAATATDQELASRIGFVPAVMEVPAGAQAALQMAFGEAGVPAVGLWARVPHYAAGTSFPEAAAVLTDELSKLIGVHIDSAALHETGRVGLQEIQTMIDNSPEHMAMVRQLEEQHDAQSGAVVNDITRIPSGDELAEELEKFLRGEGRPPA